MKKNILFLVLGIIFTIILVTNAFFWKIIMIGGQVFIAETPLSQAAYERGLGGRSGLCQNCAMLFMFSGEKMHAFWMKDMRFDLDILWIKEGKIVYIKKDFSAHSPEIIKPETPSFDVLEINAGLVEKYGFRVGDSVKIY